MKAFHRKIVFPLFLIALAGDLSAQGTSCSNAIPVTLDGVCRNYTVSSTTGSCEFCSTTGYSGNNGRITFFQFTTNSSSECVLINVTTATPVTMELLLYNACTAGTPGPSGGDYYHNMCMGSGTGLWAQNLFNNLSPNTTYYLRVRTQGGYTGNLEVCARYYTPANDDCFGATPIDSIGISDNNACHNPNYSIPATQLCAITLENTAWYTFVVKEDGSSIVTIDNIECNNGNGNSSNGFQIGFFTGDCNTMTPYSCTTGAGGTVLAPAINLLAGTRVYVAVDGYSGSNCRYTINASNAFILPVTIKNFVAWESGEKNVLKWTTTQELNNNRFEVQRSDNGTHFYTFGVVEALNDSASEKHYAFEDRSPGLHTYYRLKQVDENGKFSFSRVIELKRNGSGQVNILPLPPVQSLMKLNIASPGRKEMVLNIVDISGKILLSDRLVLQKGMNSFQKDMQRFTPGRYVVLLTDGFEKISRSFVKTGNF